MNPKSAKIDKALPYCLLCAMTLFFMSSHRCMGQVQMEFSASSGMISYQGDLSPSSIRGSISGGHGFVGLSAIFYPIRFVGLEIFMNQGKISGDDANSLGSGRKSRNLNFESKLLEYGVKVNFELPIKLSKNNHRISPIIGIGYSKASFNPRTLYNGEMVDLRPLGTEGQGLSPNSVPFYELTTWVVPVFGGIRYVTSKRWSFSVLITQNFTGTDYLDDVSKNYPNLSELEEKRGATARALSDRSLSGSANRSGMPRGDPLDNDSYVVMSFRIGKIISFNNKNRYGKRRGSNLKCPKF